jgi:hypothetical protein
MSPGRPSLRSRTAGLEDRIINYAPAPGAGPGFTLEARTPDMFEGAVRRVMAVFRDTPANDRPRGRVVAARAAVRDLSVVSLAPGSPFHPPAPPPGPRRPTVQGPVKLAHRVGAVPGVTPASMVEGRGPASGRRAGMPHTGRPGTWSRVPPGPVPIAPRARV